MNKIRKGDEVIVRTGKDKGRRGTVLQVTADGRLVVEGINVAKKHVKPNPQAGVEGGIKPIDMPIEVSNVMLFNPKTKQGERVGFRMDDDGNKVRYFKGSGDVVDI
ncbi:MAG: 50S ribosomal protein L24 [Woeseiaceae bacterium]|nr:50S ribosomal protein L24 [Woeseiaceae bacterium]